MNEKEFIENTYEYFAYEIKIKYIQYTKDKSSIYQKLLKYISRNKIPAVIEGPILIETKKY